MAKNNMLLMLLMRLQWTYSYTNTLRLHYTMLLILYANAEMTNVTLEVYYMSMHIIYDLYVLSLILPQNFMPIYRLHLH